MTKPTISNTMIEMLNNGEMSVKKILLLLISLLLMACSSAQIKKLKDDEKTKVYLEELKVKYEPEVKKLYEEKFGSKSN